MSASQSEKQIIFDALVASIATASTSSYGALVPLLAQDPDSDRTEVLQGKWAQAFLARLYGGKCQDCLETIRKWIQTERAGKVPPLSAVLPRVFRYVYLQLEFDDERGSLVGTSAVWKKTLRELRKGSRQNSQTLSNRMQNSARKNQLGVLADPRIASRERESLAESDEALARLERFLVFESEARNSRKLEGAQGLLKTAMLSQILPLEWYSDESRFWPELATLMKLASEVLMEMKSETGSSLFRKRKMTFTQDSLKTRALMGHEAILTIHRVISAFCPSFFEDLMAGGIESAMESLKSNANEKVLLALNSPPQTGVRQVGATGDQQANSGAELKISLDSFKRVLKRVGGFKCNKLAPQMLQIIVGASLEEFSGSIAHARCFTYRIVNLMAMAADPRWSNFAGSKRGGMAPAEVPEVLIAAATACPFHPDGRDLIFDPDEYFEIAGKIDSGHRV